MSERHVAAKERMEKRGSSRFDKVFPVAISSRIFGEFHGIARNISSGGMFLEVPEPAAARQHHSRPLRHARLRWRDCRAGGSEGALLLQLLGRAGAAHADGDGRALHRLRRGLAGVARGRLGSATARAHLALTAERGQDCGMVSLALLAVPIVLLGDGAAREAVPPPSRAELEALTRRLESPSTEERLAAARKITELPPAGLPLYIEKLRRPRTTLPASFRQLIPRDLGAGAQSRVPGQGRNCG